MDETAGRAPTATSAAASANQPAPAARPLKLFIHHVTYEDRPSPHFVDLKKDARHSWQAVNSLAPQTPTTLYHSYHEAPAFPEPPQPAAGLSARPFFPRPRRAGHFADALKWIRERFSSRLWLKDRLSSARRPAFRRSPTIAPATVAPVRATAPIRKKFFTLDRLAFASLVLIVLLILPEGARGYFSNLQIAKGTVRRESLAGFESLKDSSLALREGDWNAARGATISAAERFSAALDSLAEHSVAQSLVEVLPKIGDELEGRRAVLLAGQQITLGNAALLEALGAGGSAESLPARLAALRSAAERALPNYESALTNLQKTRLSYLPNEAQDSFQTFLSVFSTLVTDLRSVPKLTQTLNELLGVSGTRRYLVIFQNEAELRPTGGFMGSFAILEIKDGQIRSLAVPPGGSYDLQGQLDTYLEPPAPLALTNKRWEFQDANWFPDFPASAEKILWFYRHARGITADGVIAINSRLLPKVLTITGPIPDEKRSLTLTSENALAAIQTVVEDGPEKKERRPKQIITDLVPRLADRLTQLSPPEQLSLALLAHDALETKDVQLYLTDAPAERTIQEFGWGGAVPATDPTDDFLFVVNTNIGGQKSDVRIEQHITHQAVVSETGDVTATVVISREHLGNPTKASIYDVPNMSYLRVYVPAGSTLLEAGGFSWPEEKKFRAPEAWYIKDTDLINREQEIGVDARSGTRITREFGKTAFGNWIITPVGSTSEIYFTFKLPFRLPVAAAKRSLKQVVLSEEPTIPYQLIVQKQSGSASRFQSQIIFPAGWRPLWKNGAEMALAENGAAIGPINLDNDQVWSLLMEKSD